MLSFASKNHMARFLARRGWTPESDEDQALLVAEFKKHRRTKQFDSKPFQKTAIDWGMLHGLLEHAQHIVPAAVAGHFGSNVLMGALRNSPLMRRVEEGMMAAGLRHGIEGKSLHPIIKGIGNRVLGPEAFMPYELARKAGPGLAAIPEDMRNVGLQAAKQHVQSSPHLRNAPVVRSLPRAVERLSRQPDTSSFEAFQRSRDPGFLESLPTTSGRFADSWKGTALDVASGVGLSALSPEHAGHFMANAGRRYLANRPEIANMGQKMLERGLAKQEPTPLARRSAETLLSPMFYAEQDLGRALGKDINARPELYRGPLQGARDAGSQAAQRLLTGGGVDAMRQQVGPHLAEMAGALRGVGGSQKKPAVDLKPAAETAAGAVGSMRRMTSLMGGNLPPTPRGSATAPGPT